MRALRTYTVTTRLPESLRPLHDLAMNLGWLSDEHVRDIFRRVDPDLWDHDRHDAVAFLARVPQERLDRLAEDPVFTARARAILDDLTRDLDDQLWFDVHERGDLRTIAYFSAEFGIAQSLPQYSGGLGVLAGDHLKAASDLGVPLVAIGLCYHLGYFRQELDENGWQREHFPPLDPNLMALEEVPDIRVHVEVNGTSVALRLWKAKVGRVPLYLLDPYLPENSPEVCAITDRLYGGGIETRIKQEIILGVGGVRALEALGVTPDVVHLNEGHAAFAALERIRIAMVERGLTLEEAIEATRPSLVFTTHTVVPAGIDRFPRALVESHLGWWADACGVSIERLFDLGQEPGDGERSVVNMAYLAFRLAGSANGVSALHGQISREIFGGAWPGVPVEDVPIKHVTNGVHGNTWVSREMGDLLERHIGGDWAEADASRWIDVEAIPDEELWAVRRTNRERMVTFARRRLRTQVLVKGGTPAEAEWCETVLDPSILTIGFARRFASYKRATLLLRDADRLRRLLLSTDRPVQLVFAGKAHPADDPGKELLQEIAVAAGDLGLRHRFVFIEDYDIGVARIMVRGVDVWLNNPLRPFEASGTSGMKAALNGVFNLSILDGWWAEMYDSEVGWTIPSAERIEDRDARDAAEADALMSILEDEIVPRFYLRAADGFPRDWVRMVKRMVHILGPQVTAARMMRDYVEQIYAPAAARNARLSDESGARARDLVAWKGRVREAWSGVSVGSIESESLTEFGSTHRITADVRLGSLAPSDVRVELLHGAIGWSDTIRSPAAIVMSPASGGLDDALRYSVELPSARSGRYGFVVRAVPSNPDLGSYADVGPAAWAS